MNLELPFYLVVSFVCAVLTALLARYGQRYVDTVSKDPFRHMAAFPHMNLQERINYIQSQLDRLRFAVALLKLICVSAILATVYFLWMLLFG